MYESHNIFTNFALTTIIIIVYYGNSFFGAVSNNANKFNWRKQVNPKRFLTRLSGRYAFSYICSTFSTKKKFINNGGQNVHNLIVKQKYQLMFRVEWNQKNRNYFLECHSFIYSFASNIVNIILLTSTKIRCA